MAQDTLETKARAIVREMAVAHREYPGSMDHPSDRAWCAALISTFNARVITAEENRQLLWDERIPEPPTR